MNGRQDNILLDYEQAGIVDDKYRIQVFKHGKRVKLRVSEVEPPPLVRVEKSVDIGGDTRKTN